MRRFGVQIMIALPAPVTCDGGTAGLYFTQSGGANCPAETLLGCCDRPHTLRCGLGHQARAPLPVVRTCSWLRCIQLE